jgi:hypothetical protein
MTEHYLPYIEKEMRNVEGLRRIARVIEEDIHPEKA